MVLCKTRDAEYTVDNKDTMYDMRRRRRENSFDIIKKFPEPCFSAALELRGEGGRGSRGGGEGVQGGGVPPPLLGMKIKASPWGGATNNWRKICSHFLQEWEDKTPMDPTCRANGQHPEGFQTYVFCRAQQPPQQAGDLRVFTVLLAPGAHLV